VFVNSTLASLTYEHYLVPSIANLNVSKLAFITNQYPVVSSIRVKVYLYVYNRIIRPLVF